MRKSAYSKVYSGPACISLNPRRQGYLVFPPGTLMNKILEVYLAVYSSDLGSNEGRLLQIHRELSKKK